MITTASQTWWKPLANHCWRAFFSMRENRSQNDSPSSAVKYSACNSVFFRLPERDRNIIHTFYTAKWGDIVYAVEDCSDRSGIPVSAVYAVLSHAQRAVVEQFGLIEPERK